MQLDFVAGGQPFIPHVTVGDLRKLYTTEVKTYVDLFDLRLAFVLRVLRRTDPGVPDDALDNLTESDLARLCARCTKEARDSALSALGRAVAEAPPA